jgi:hypothetical protein
MPAQAAKAHHDRSRQDRFIARPFVSLEAPSSLQNTSGTLPDFRTARQLQMCIGSQVSSYEHTTIALMAAPD